MFLKCIFDVSEMYIWWFLDVIALFLRCVCNVLKMCFWCFELYFGCIFDIFLIFYFRDKHHLQYHFTEIWTLTDNHWFSHQLLTRLVNMLDQLNLTIVQMVLQFHTVPEHSMLVRMVPREVLNCPGKGEESDQLRLRSCPELKGLLTSGSNQGMKWYLKLILISPQTMCQGEWILFR